METGGQYIPIGEVDKRISEIEELLQQLPVELDALRRIRSGAMLIDFPRKRTEMLENGVAVINGGKLGPSDAVIDYLSRNPHSQSATVVSLLMGAIVTGAKDKKRCLKSTIYNLVQRGKIDQDSQGLLTVSPNGKA